MNNEKITNLGDVKPIVLIGGKTGKFVPNLNMSFHDDEFFINLNREDKIITDEIAEVVDFRTVLNGNDSDIFHVNGNGEFKWDIELKEKPESNIFKWKLKSKGVEFFYQPELTPEEIADGCIRPIEAIGSYAVYCNKSNNRYKTGKVCHIYRPYCYDANGLNIYADLKIKDGYLTITIPEEYLDKAVYPVYLDPAFGYTSIGASTDYWSTVQASKPYSTPASNGTLDYVIVHCRNSSSLNLRAGIYSDSSGSPNSLLASNDTGVETTSTLSWVSCPVSYSGITAGASYWLAHLNTSSGNLVFSYDTVSAELLLVSGSNSFVTTFNETNTFNQRKSIYASYTESGGGAVEGSLVGQSPLVGGGVLCGQGNLIN